MVPVGTSVEYIYEPAKIGLRQGHIYLSVHEDVYFKIPSRLDHVLDLIEKRFLARQVDTRKVIQTVEEHSGNLMDITKQVAGGLNIQCA